MPNGGDGAGRRWSCPSGALGQHLRDLETPRLEGQRSARHVQAPDPRPALSDLRYGEVPRGLEIGNPCPERQGVVLSERLHVTGLEPRALHGGDHYAHLVQLGVGEDVAVGEVSQRRASTVGRHASDGMVEEGAAGTDEGEATIELHLQLAQPHVLEHSDRADGVVGTVVDVR